VRLKKADREKLSDVLGGGLQPVRTVLRALTLGHLHEGKSVSEVASIVRFRPRLCGRLDAGTMTPVWNRRSMISRGRVRHPSWKRANDTALLPWSAVIRLRATPDGPFAWCGG